VGHYLQSNFAELATTNPAALKGFDMSKLDGISSNTAVLKTLPPEIQATALNAFVNSFHIVFFAAAPVTAIGFLLALKLRETPLRSNQEYAAAREEAVGESLG
jgi:ABC-type Fe3+ transport system permease subunit